MHSNGYGNFRSMIKSGIPRLVQGAYAGYNMGMLGEGHLE